jgi:glycerophosphoryl diester phosphodiesterase
VRLALAVSFILPYIAFCQPPDRIPVQGHRGARAIRPENALLAFEYAIGQGVDVLELDLGVTKDNVVVVSHDSILRAPIGTGPKPEAVIREVTLDEVKQMGLRRRAESGGCAPTACAWISACFPIVTGFVLQLPRAFRHGN